MAYPFLLGDLSRNHIQLSILQRARADSTEYYDVNWLITTLSVKIGPWTGEFASAERFLTDELQDLLAQLELLNRDLKSPVKFSPLEPDLHFEIIPDSLGNLVVHGSLDDGRDETQLEFRMELDQSYLPKMIAELKTIVEAFPVLLTPNP